jgi:hypothetical protein
VELSQDLLRIFSDHFEAFGDAEPTLQLEPSTEA